MQIYESVGVSPRDAAKRILEKNIYGLDIDRRVYQLAYFSLMMKARRYDSGIFTEGAKVQVYYPGGFAAGEEYGSLVKVDAVEPKPDEPKEGALPDEKYETRLNAWNFKRLLALKYDAVVTNPPYIGGKGKSRELIGFLKKEYPDSKSDTFSAFIERCGEMAEYGGYVGMFTPYVWMFIQSYEKLRNMLYAAKDIITLIQFEYSAFEEATVPVCAFILRNGKTGATGEYLRLADYRGGMEVQRVKTLDAIENPQCGYRYTMSTENFKKIPGGPMAYWVGENMFKAFENRQLSEIANVRTGMTTANNERFLRLWFEVSSVRFSTTVFDRVQLVQRGIKWLPYNKGGDYRKWYGNNKYVVNWENDGYEIKNFTNKASGKARSGGYNDELILREGLTWTYISSSNFGVRYTPAGFHFDNKGSMIFCESGLHYLLGFWHRKFALKCSVL